MTPYHRNVLLETGYALEHLLWSYRSELDRSPTRNLSADDICLSDFAARTSSLVRGVIDGDNERRGPRLAFRPPSGTQEKRMAEALQARRHSRAVDEAMRDTNDAPSPLKETSDVEEIDDAALAPDAVSPSRMPLRSRPR